MNGLQQDLRSAARQFVKTPGLALVVVITIAVGVGANTALFSVVNGVLLNPLPYPHPEELVTLHESKPNFDSGSISFPNFRDWRKDNHTFSAMAIYRGYAFSLTGVGDALQVNGEFVASDFFSILGVKPMLGRSFAQGEDEIGANPIAVISEGLWQRKLASAPDIVGKGMTLDGRGYTIIGVIPANFHFALGNSATQPEVYVPVGQWKNNLLDTRSAGLGFHGVGRLKPEVTIEQAAADMRAVTNSLAMAFPDANKGISAKLIPLKQWMVGGVRPILLVLLGSVSFVLLIACVDVANLLLARSTSRTREFRNPRRPGGEPAARAPAIIGGERYARAYGRCSRLTAGRVGNACGPKRSSHRAAARGRDWHRCSRTPLHAGHFSNGGSAVWTHARSEDVAPQPAGYS